MKMKKLPAIVGVADNAAAAAAATTVMAVPTCQWRGDVPVVMDTAAAAASTELLLCR